ncbi:MAG: glycosyltransferase family 2 protein [Smithellaceae bacterium]
MLPYFSIIIPMYNRERFIARAINSCLNQDFENYEIIVVDDGSTDKSVNVVKKYTDPRIKLICHKVNRGAGPARNTGVDEATGEWVICFDSDDELLPGALYLILRRSNEVDGNISRLQFMVQMDSEEISPDPPLKNEFWDYVKYIKWMEGCYGKRSESLQVVRRAAFEKVRYYDDRTLEGPYHLDFMKQFNAWSFPDVVRLYYHDAENQLTKQNMSRTIEGAQDQALSGELLLKNHGEALKLHAPQIYGRQVSGLATLCFLSGNRLKGIKYSFSSLRSNFLSLRYWVILLLGLLGAKPLAWLKYFRSRLLQMRIN